MRSLLETIHKLSNDLTQGTITSSKAHEKFLEFFSEFGLELIDFQCSTSRVSDPKGPASSSAEFRDFFEWRIPHNIFSFKKTPGSPGILKLLTELYNQSVQSWSSELVELLNTLSDVIYRIDEQGHFTYLSPSIERWGYEPQALIGKHFSTLIDPLDVDRVSREKVIETYR